MNESLMSLIIIAIPFVLGLGIPLICAIPFKISEARNKDK